MKAKIVEMQEILDEVECKIKYRVVLWFEENPKLVLGNCEIKQ